MSAENRLTREGIDSDSAAGAGGHAQAVSTGKIQRQGRAEVEAMVEMGLRYSKCPEAEAQSFTRIIRDDPAFVGMVKTYRGHD